MKNVIEGLACGFASGLTFFSRVVFPDVPQGDGEGFPTLGWWIVGVAAGVSTAVAVVIGAVAFVVMEVMA